MCSASALRSVEDTAGGGGNSMPRILQAVESYATMGQIANVMRRCLEGIERRRRCGGWKLRFVEVNGCDRFRGSLLSAWRC